MLSGLSCVSLSCGWTLGGVRYLAKVPLQAELTSKPTSHPSFSALISAEWNTMMPLGSCGVAFLCVGGVFLLVRLTLNCKEIPLGVPLKGPVLWCDK